MIWERGDDVHFHTWTYESFGELIAYIETAQGQAWSNVWSRPRLSKHDIEFYYAMTK